MSKTNKNYWVAVDNKVVAKTNSFQTAMRLLQQFATEDSSCVKIYNFNIPKELQKD